MSPSDMIHDYENMVDSTLETVKRLGFWSAVMTAVLSAVFIGLGFFGTLYTEPNPYPYIWPFIKTIDYTIFYPAFLLAPVFVVLMACIHSYASEKMKIFSLVGLSFSLIYATLITANYFLLWTVDIPSISSGQTANLSIITMYNPHGIFVAIESLGYLMMSLAILFTAAVFSGGRLERSIRWLFILTFVSAITAFTYTSLMKYDIVIFEVIIIGIITMVLIVSGILLSILFRRA